MGCRNRKRFYFDKGLSMAKVMEDVKELLGLPQHIIDILHEDFPKSAFSAVGGKAYLTTLKAIYIIERLNKAFGIGRWVVDHEIIERTDDFVLVGGSMRLLDYPELVFPVTYGGHQTTGKGTDIADGYKSAVTDLTSKQSSYLEIALDLYKGNISASGDNKAVHEVKKQVEKITAGAFAKKLSETKKSFEAVSKLGGFKKFLNDNYGTDNEVTIVKEHLQSANAIINGLRLVYKGEK